MASLLNAVSVSTRLLWVTQNVFMPLFFMSCSCHVPGSFFGQVSRVLFDPSEVRKREKGDEIEEREEL